MAKVIECENKRMADCCQRCGRSKRCGLQFSVECIPQGVIMPCNWICDSFVQPASRCENGTKAETVGAVEYPQIDEFKINGPGAAR